MSLKNNTLYQYSGGGYSGCVWEWNFFFIDKDGAFHDIFSSGSGGITDLVSAEEVCVDNADDVYTYYLDNPDDLDELARKTNAVLVLGLVKWFEENQNNEVYAICGDCGCEVFDPDEIRDDGVDVLCYECHLLGMCNECCDYVGVDDICHVVSKIGDLIDFSHEVLQQLAENLADDIHHCKYCLEILAQDIDNNLQRSEN